MGGEETPSLSLVQEAGLDKLALAEILEDMWWYEVFNVVSPAGAVAASTFVEYNQSIIQSII